MIRSFTYEYVCARMWCSACRAHQSSAPFVAPRDTLRARRLDLRGAIDSLVGLGADDPYGTARQVAHALGHRSEEEAGYASPPVRADDHQIRVEICGELHDLVGYRAPSNVNDDALHRERPARL